MTNRTSESILDAFGEILKDALSAITVEIVALKYRAIDSSSEEEKEWLNSRKDSLQSKYDHIRDRLQNLARP